MIATQEQTATKTSLADDLIRLAEWCVKHGVEHNDSLGCQIDYAGKPQVHLTLETAMRVGKGHPIELHPDRNPAFRVDGVKVVFVPEEGCEVLP